MNREKNPVKKLLVKGLSEQAKSTLGLAGSVLMPPLLLWLSDYGYAMLLLMMTPYLIGGVIGWRLYHGGKVSFGGGSITPGTSIPVEQQFKKAA